MMANSFLFSGTEVGQSAADSLDNAATSPMRPRGAKAKRESAGLLRYLTRKEFDRLLAAAKVNRSKGMALFVRLAVASGLRLGRPPGCFRHDGNLCLHSTGLRGSRGS